MAELKPPPLRGCIVHQLIEVDGDNWARMVLRTYPSLLWHAKQQAKICEKCAETLTRLFPNGFPDIAAEKDPPELEEVLRQLREETGKVILAPDDDQSA